MTILKLLNTDRFSSSLNFKTDLQTSSAGKSIAEITRITGFYEEVIIKLLNGQTIGNKRWSNNFISVRDNRRKILEEIMLSDDVDSIKPTGANNKIYCWIRLHDRAWFDDLVSRAKLIPNKKSRAKIWTSKEDESLLISLKNKKKELLERNVLKEGFKIALVKIDFMHG